MASTSASGPPQIDLPVDQAAITSSGTLHAAVCPLAPRSESVKIARDFTRVTLRDWDAAALFDDMGLVVSELVTNALRYGLVSDIEDPSGLLPLPMTKSSAYPIELSLLRNGLHIMCAVADPSTRAPKRREPDHLTETGRGLHLVEFLSCEWGWSPRGEEGKAVWALFHITDPA